MAGLKGQARLPHQPDPRVRRNAAGLSTDAEFLFSGALTLVNGVVVLSLVAPSSGLSQTSGLTILLAAGSGLTLSPTGLAVDNTVYVPYTGATTDVVLGAHFLSANQIRTPEIKTDGTTPTDLTITTGAAKTAVLATSVWNDMYTSIPIDQDSANYLSFVGNLNEWVFGVNDTGQLSSIEILHNYKEGTDLSIHVHWATRGTNAGVTGVKWEIEYSITPVGSVFPTTTVISSEDTIPGGTASLTHRLLLIGTIPGAGLTIGSQLKMRIRRIASSGAAPSVSPYLLQVGIHYQVDTVGSRQITTK